ncbi:Cif family virulence factor [Neptunitalea lumnitzerae]|nr:nuclear transport factor 2 family protein [Neptunitalea sp. Y10]
MKYLLFVCISVMLTGSMKAQDTQKKEVTDTVKEFFKAFHAQDTVALRAFAYGYVELQSIAKDKTGATQLHNETYETFVKSIGSIPDNVTFEERILNYDIRVDGDMANAWTPYEFYLNGEFSHCGVNSFQFLKTEEGWKIIYLVDTRRRESCK